MFTLPCLHFVLLWLEIQIEVMWVLNWVSPSNDIVGCLYVGMHVFERGYAKYPNMCLL